MGPLPKPTWKSWVRPQNPHEILGLPQNPTTCLDLSLSNKNPESATTCRVMTIMDIFINQCGQTIVCSWHWWIMAMSFNDCKAKDQWSFSLFYLGLMLTAHLLYAFYPAYGVIYCICDLLILQVAGIKPLSKLQQNSCSWSHIVGTRLWWWCTLLIVPWCSFCRIKKKQKCHVSLISDDMKKVSYDITNVM